MELDLKELGITLLVGAFTILGFEAILHYFFNKGLIGFFQGKLGLDVREPAATNADDTETKGSSRRSKAEKEQTLTIAVFITFAFAAGIVFEDLSLKYVDSQQIPFRTIPAKLLPASVIDKLDLPSAEDDRVATLIGGVQNPQPNPLARDLATNDAFKLHGSESDAKVQKWILNEQRCKPGDAGADCPTGKEIEDSIKNLYYYAKNTVYAQPQHYDELRRIQDRYEFTRSLSMIAFFYFAVAIVLGTPLFIWRSFEHKKGGSVDNRLHELRGHIPVVVTTLLLVYFLSLWAFARESDAFNRRAFGYLSTMLISEKHQRDQAARDQAARDQLKPANQGVSNPNPQPGGTPQAKP